MCPYVYLDLQLFSRPRCACCIYVLCSYYIHGLSSCPREEIWQPLAPPPGHPEDSLPPDRTTRHWVTVDQDYLRNEEVSLEDREKSLGPTGRFSSSF